MTTHQQALNITQFLPHRDPMLLVDYITEITENFVITRYVIPTSSIFLKNNFFQESGVIENMAQTCSAIVGQTYFDHSLTQPEQKTKVLGFISGIKKVEIVTLPKVEQLLITKAELVSRFEGEDYNLCTMNVTTFCNEQLIAKANINLFLQKVQ